MPFELNKSRPVTRHPKCVCVCLSVDQLDPTSLNVMSLVPLCFLLEESVIATVSVLFPLGQRCVSVCVCVRLLVVDVCELY